MFAGLLDPDPETSCTVELVEKLENLPAETNKVRKMVTWANEAENLRKFRSENPRITNGAKIRQTGIRKVQSSSSAQREQN
jgi:hypothetical protein